MSATLTTPQIGRSFVLLRLAAKRFALPAEAVVELVVPGSLQSFPHSDPLLAGVLVRRGHVVPVADVARVVANPDAQRGKFYLIATRHFGEEREWCAIPVTGDCELVNAAAEAPDEGEPVYVAGELQLAEERVPVLDLDGVFAARDEENSFAEAQS